MRRLRSLINIVSIVAVPNFHSCTISYASAVVGLKQQEQERRKTLECNDDVIDPIILHWSIPEPTYETRLSRITLHYELYNTITKDDMEITVYSDHQCGATPGSTVIDRPYLSTGIIENNEQSSSSSSSCSKKFDVAITINPSEIMKTSSYILSTADDSPKNNNTNSTATIQLCVRMILYDSVQSGDDGDDSSNTAVAAAPFEKIPVTINEMLLSLSCDITKNFLITNSDVVLKSTLKNEEIEKLAELNGYNVTIYRCDRQFDSIENQQYHDSSSLLPMISRSDNPIRICITPDDIALQQGIKIDKINYFYYQQNDSNNTLLFKQTAVKVDGKVSNDQLSLLSCQSGSVKCAVETELRTPFFINDADEVIIYGEVEFINFGSKPFEGVEEYITENKNSNATSQENGTSGDNSRRLESLRTTFQYKFKIGLKSDENLVIEQSSLYDTEKKIIQEENETNIWSSFKRKILPIILGVYTAILIFCTASSVRDAKNNINSNTTENGTKGNDNIFVMKKWSFRRKGNNSSSTIEKRPFGTKNNNDAMRKEFGRGPIPQGFNDEIFDCI